MDELVISIQEDSPNFWNNEILSFFMSNLLKILFFYVYSSILSVPQKIHQYANKYNNV